MTDTHGRVWRFLGGEWQRVSFHYELWKDYFVLSLVGTNFKPH